ncbi:MAG: hypothetical protein WDA42_03625 [Candidatus Bathyarchaeia archaeon]
MTIQDQLAKQTRENFPQPLQWVTFETIETREWTEFGFNEAEEGQI